MKTISLWQPWASAIAVGAKKIETRHWFTPYRGLLAIHAAKKDNAELREFYTWKQCDVLREAGYAGFDDLPFGAVVAVCRMVECLRTSDIDGLSAQERAFGDYTPGRYGWVLTDIQRLDRPIPFRGAQGFFDVPDELLCAQIGMLKCRTTEQPRLL